MDRVYSFPVFSAISGPEKRLQTDLRLAKSDFPVLVTANPSLNPIRFLRARIGILMHTASAKARGV